MWCYFFQCMTHISYITRRLCTSHVYCTGTKSSHDWNILTFDCKLHIKIKCLGNLDSHSTHFYRNVSFLLKIWISTYSCLEKVTFFYKPTILSISLSTRLSHPFSRLALRSLTSLLKIIIHLFIKKLNYSILVSLKIHFLHLNLLSQQDTNPSNPTPISLKSHHFIFPYNKNLSIGSGDLDVSVEELG